MDNHLKLKHNALLEKERQAIAFMENLDDKKFDYYFEKYLSLLRDIAESSKTCEKSFSCTLNEITNGFVLTEQQRLI